MFEQLLVKPCVLKDLHSIAYVLQQIREVHSKEYGWDVGEPRIIPNSDGKTVTLMVRLTKNNDLKYGRYR